MKPKSERVMEGSDDDAPIRSASTAVKRKKLSALISSSDEEDEEGEASRPKKKPTPVHKPSPRPSANGPSTSKAKPRTSTSATNKPPPRKLKKDKDFIMLSDHDSPDDEDGESDDDELIPQKKSNRTPVKKAKAPAKSAQPKTQKQSEKGKLDESAQPPAKKPSKCARFLLLSLQHTHRHDKYSAGQL